MVQSENSNYIIKFEWIFLIFFLFSNVITYSQNQLINEVFENYNVLFSNNFYNFSQDTLNQLQISSTTNISSKIIEIDKIPLFSRFDGNYNIQFFKNFLMNKKDSSIFFFEKNADSQKDSSSYQFFLFSSNYNGLLMGKTFVKKKNFFWRINPVFESSGGYYYSNRSSENLFDLRFLENSSYQNIGLDLGVGFLNNSSEISLNILYNVSNLYIPVKLSDTTKYKQHFNSYDSFLGYLKFKNQFTDNLTFEGNFFFKRFLRNYGSSLDSSFIILHKYNSKFEIDEFNYGGNLLLGYNPFNLVYPLDINFCYSQNIFLLTNAFNQNRTRTESENLSISLGQKFSITNKLNLNLEGDLNSRAILYSELGKIPANKSQIDYKICLDYQLGDSSIVDFDFNKFYVFPFISNYFGIQPNQLENGNLNSEDWSEFTANYSELFSNFNLKISGDFSIGKNIIFPYFLDSSKFRYESSGKLSSFGAVFEINFNLFSLEFKTITKVNFEDFSVDNLKLIQAYRLPDFSNFISINKKFDFGLNITLNNNYTGGLYSFDSNSQEIKRMKKFLIMNLLLQQKVYSQDLFLGIRNLTNQLYETNYSVPLPGINVLFGVNINL